jgi:hypothetical protein
LAAVSLTTAHFDPLLSAHPHGARLFYLAAKTGLGLWRQPAPAPLAPAWICFLGDLRASICLGGEFASRLQHLRCLGTPL